MQYVCTSSHHTYSYVHKYVISCLHFLSPSPAYSYIQLLHPSFTNHTVHVSSLFSLHTYSFLSYKIATLFYYTYGEIINKLRKQTKCFHQKSSYFYFFCPEINQAKFYYQICGNNKNNNNEKEKKPYVGLCDVPISLLYCSVNVLCLYF